MIGRARTNNLRWAAERVRADPEYFARLSAGRPELLWIGCSDAPLAAHEMLGLAASDLIVHCNLGNLAPTQDPAGLSVLQYAVETVAVRHIVVCGHHGCSAVAAAMEDGRRGFADHWLQPVRALHADRRTECDAIREPRARANRLSELNVASQVRTLAADPIVLDAWRRGAALSVHGWMWSASDGLVRELGISVSEPGGGTDRRSLSADKRLLRPLR